jgi:hypothetical protein
VVKIFSSETACVFRRPEKIVGFSDVDVEFDGNDANLVRRQIGPVFGDELPINQLSIL